MLRLSKLVVQAVVLEEDEDGVVLGERISDAAAVYGGREGVIAFIDALLAQLEEEGGK